MVLLLQENQHPQQLKFINQELKLAPHPGNNNTRVLHNVVFIIKLRKSRNKYTHLTYNVYKSNKKKMNERKKKN